MTKAKLKPLTRTQLDQLLTYANWVKASGDYYGPKGLFDKRHEAIVEWLQGCLDRLKGQDDAN